MDNLEIITLTKRGLKEALTKNKFWSDSYQPPFSINKAKWMLDNTRADENDIFAILGYEKFTIIAFVYLVPDLIKGEDGSSKKVFWSQRWWVSDKYKETILSTYVKNISLNECGNQVIIKFLGDKSKAYYEKQPFRKFSKRKRYIILFSLDYDLLVYKNANFKKISHLVRFADGMTRRLISLINKSKRLSNGIEYENVQVIDNDVWNFIDKHINSDVVPKSKEYINWQINNNQYHVIKNNENNLNNKCLLGTISKKIYNSNIVVKHGNEIIGFISGFVTRKRFIVRYFITTETYYKDCLNILIKNLITSKCTLLQTENSILGERVVDRYLNVYSDKKELVSLIHDDVIIKIDKINMTDQDGNYF